MKVKLEYYYWKVPFGDGTNTYIKTGVWQTKPYNAIEITKKEYEFLTNRKINDNNK